MTSFASMKPKDVVCLSDEQTIRDLMEDKADNAMDGLQLTITNVRHIREQSGLANWYLADLAVQGDVPLVLMAKVVDDATDLRIYYPPDDVGSGNRLDLLEKGNQWLFKEPRDVDDFVPADLKMAETIDQEVDGTQVVYAVKGGTLHGESFETPRPSGIDQPQFVGITEYAVEDDQYESVENPELVVLEVGGLDEDGDPLEDGGLMIVLQGANVNPNDVTLMSV